MMECIFCKIAEGSVKAAIVHQDEKIVCFHDLHPQAPVHCLVIPRKHITHLLDLSPEDGALMGHLIATIPSIARRLGLEEQGFRIVNNCKEMAGQSVFHLHFHLLGGRSFRWPPG